MIVCSLVSCKVDWCIMFPFLCVCVVLPFLLNANSVFSLCHSVHVGVENPFCHLKFNLSIWRELCTPLEAKVRQPCGWKIVLWYLMMNADQDLFMNCYLFLNLNGCFKTHMLTMLFKQLFEFLRYGNQLPVINTFFLSNSLWSLFSVVAHARVPTSTLPWYTVYF